MELEFSGQVFKKHSNIKFHEKSVGRTDIDIRKNIKRLIVAFRSFANAPKKGMERENLTLHCSYEVTLHLPYVSCFCQYFYTAFRLLLLS